MALITEDMTLADVAQLPGMLPLADYLMECRPSNRDETYSMPLAVLREQQGDANADAVIRGLERLVGVVQSRPDVVQDIWTYEEQVAVPGRARTKLVFFPGKAGAPFVMIAPGGGYNAVCSHLEGYPAAARLNEAGYNAFVLSYRTREFAAPPGPLEDLAQALRHVLAYAQELDVAPCYALMGFSAGAHLAGLMATDVHGWRTWQLPRPSAMVLNYPVIDLRTLVAPDANLWVKEMIDVMFGLEPTQAELTRWSINECAGSDFPPTYLWQCEDDDVVPFENLKLMDTRLSELGVQHVAKAYRRGGHGLVKPHDAEADRWMDDVLRFLNDVL